MYADNTAVTFSAENTAGLEFQLQTSYRLISLKLSFCLLQQDKSVRLLMINVVLI